MSSKAWGSRSPCQVTQASIFNSVVAWGIMEREAVCTPAGAAWAVTLTGCSGGWSICGLGSQWSLNRDGSTCRVRGCQSSEEWKTAARYHGNGPKTPHFPSSDTWNRAYQSFFHYAPKGTHLDIVFLIASPYKILVPQIYCICLCTVALGRATVHCNGLETYSGPSPFEQSHPVENACPRW